MSAAISFTEFLDKHISTVEPLSHELNLAWWELQTTSSSEAEAKVIELTTRMARIYANPDEYAYLCNLDLSSLLDANARRQCTLLRNAYLSNQMEPEIQDKIIALSTEIEKEFNNFRATLNGSPLSDNELEEILLTSEDAAQRKAAWEASKTVGAVVAERVRELARLRNKEAKRLGFANYYSMGLALQEVDEARLFNLLDQLHTECEPLWSVYKAQMDSRIAARFGIRQEDIRPWHYANRFFQDTEPSEQNLDVYYADKDLAQLTDVFFKEIGLPVDDLLKTADLYEREAKCQHAFCADIDRKGDVRVLCNLRSNERWMDTMLHEFGHAVYSKFNAPELPFLLRDCAHIMTTEAIAQFMGRLARNPAFLVRYVGVAPDEAAKIGRSAAEHTRGKLLVFMHWCFVMAHFERAFYVDPEQDLDSLWWSLVAKFQRLTPPEGRKAPDWAAKIHIATAPVYYHNYLLGEMIVSQLLHSVRTDLLESNDDALLVTSPKLGAWMKEALFMPGATRTWEEWLETATGEPLSPAYFVDQLKSQEDPTR